MSITDFYGFVEIQTICFICVNLTMFNIAFDIFQFNKFTRNNNCQVLYYLIKPCCDKFYFDDNHQFWTPKKQTKTLFRGLSILSGALIILPGQNFPSFDFAQTMSIFFDKSILKFSRTFLRIWRSIRKTCSYLSNVKKKRKRRCYSFKKNLSVFLT